jgi:hypothetical protein
MAQDVVAHFMITERGTNRVVCPFTDVKIKTQQGVAAARVTLPASLIAARFLVVYFTMKEAQVEVCKEQKQILPLGLYTARIEVLSGDKLHKAEHEFVVRDSYPFAVWSN